MLCLETPKKDPVKSTHSAHRDRMLSPELSRDLERNVRQYVITNVLHTSYFGKVTILHIKVLWDWSNLGFLSVFQISWVCRLPSA